MTLLDALSLPFLNVYTLLFAFYTQLDYQVLPVFHVSKH